MKIVAVDGYTLNPGDLSWSQVEKMGELTVYERSTPEEVIERCQDAEIILTNKAIVNAAAIRSLPALRYIGVTATGYNVVDIEAAKERGIPVSNAAGYSSPSVAQHVFSLLLALCTRTEAHAESVRNGDWSRSKDFCYWLQSPVELSGKTMGIVGLGQIGKATARIALGMGMQVISSHKHPERDAMEGVRFTDLETCFRESDAISLHCPLNDQNKGFVNKELLATMKPTAYLINTSRGPLLNEQDVADALNKGIIAGAGLDVLSTEPPPAGNPLIAAKNCLITPHIAWASKASRQRLMDIVAANINAFLEGHPVNVINR
ncbi:glycerate dehydrogenase [Anseongella ginsenosidimutans]|uniref:Glycerate dehydrogenase n=1 Tax=Anseongella ginsenosidimutans TaxID=496056 RepID=A0A4R3KPI0_9SPHI|nr:D-2-hydroxyacid dehydrogenase [Anseongella ginsenosidimutans]QEC53942.1 D-2-hydroxyacid dehydrogenase [Anseongella ginsenosidimutans]TCS86329.1 glycerate dehydrogenase [Anseongella ginsenosidimutans]